VEGKSEAAELDMDEVDDMLFVIRCWCVLK
jgi:hypothetical protein